MQRLTFNSVHLGGNLVADPAFSVIHGVNTVSFTIAIEDGTKTAPHASNTPCRAVGEVASTIGKWFAQSDRILVTGNLRTVPPLSGKGPEQLTLIVSKVHMIENAEPRTKAAATSERPSGTRQFKTRIEIATKDREP